MPKRIRLTTDIFVERAKKVHGSLYDYSKVNYINNKIKVCIICHKHGKFWQDVNSHIHKCGCPKCGRESASRTKTHTTQQHIESFKKVHGDLYDYSKYEHVVGENAIVICKIHGKFSISIGNHKSGKGCPICYGSPKKTIKEFITGSNQIHINKYDYSKVEYIDARTKVCIICPKHGEFWQTPNSHLSNHGCPNCIASRGNKTIHRWLTENNIKHIREKRFCNCRDKNTLPFDFYIPTYNTIVEYDGRQHFEVIEYFGGSKGFKIRQNHDKIKNKYCDDNNIHLIRIRYDEDIASKLNELLIK